MNEPLIRFLRSDKVTQYSRGSMFPINERLVKAYVAALKKLLTPNMGFTFNGYAYYPTDNKFNKWVASDGSVIKCTHMEDFLFDYAGRDLFLDFMRMDVEDIIREYTVKKRMRQEEYEAGKMMGDHN